MARFIGMDEAGLGPNLGPFVVAVTVWDVPAKPRRFDFWKTFADALTNAPAADEARLHIADSKEVFQPHRGLRSLERGVLAALRLIGHEPDSFAGLCELLSSEGTRVESTAGTGEWYHEVDFALPAEQHDFSIVETWKQCCERHNVRLVAIKAAILETQHFNQLVRDCDNKAMALSRIGFKLLRSVWNPDDPETFIVGDKHGGRNRYDELLAEVVDGEMIFRLEEGADRSEYRIGKTLLRFQPRAEVHGPVALASMTAKYVRELSMAQFNRFWARHIDGLKPTQGYPVDARRFREAIAPTQKQLAISDDHLWRCR